MKACLFFLAIMMLVVIVGCGQSVSNSAESDNAVKPTGPPPTVQGWRSVAVVSGISHPWGLAWLDQNRALITSRGGTIYLLSEGRLQEVVVDGMPELFVSGQGGLLDISLHPRDRGQSVRVYMTMSTGSDKANRTILASGIFDGRRIHSVREIFRVQPDKSGSQHFGSRLLWLPDGTLLMSIGDGGNPPLRVGGMLAREQAQNLRSHLGSVVRLTDEGRPAPGNPFVDSPDALPEIWSYGHRNIQGFAIDSRGRVWANEHGPRGGDELNLLHAGQNYGWPVQTWGRDYVTRLPIGQTQVSGVTGPKAVWSPAHAPSGLAIYTGQHFPRWRGSLMSGGLVSEDVRIIRLDEQDNVAAQERIDIDSRVRDVSMGPDGYLYLLTDEENGRLLRIEPERTKS